MSDTPKFQPKDSSAGGWGALHATAKALRQQSARLKGGDEGLLCDLAGRRAGAAERLLAGGSGQG
jgi:hypothetical protein